MLRKKPIPTGTDYTTYREIMGELLCPIRAEGLDLDTLKGLYVSKSVYLENLRLKCFWELNSSRDTFFRWKDYDIVVQAIQQTRNHLRNLIVYSLSDTLSKRKAS